MAKTRVDKYGNKLADGPMSSSLPEGPNSGSLQGRRSGVVATMKKKTVQQTPPVGQSSGQTEDINALFQGLRQQGTPNGVRKPVVRRGFSGHELNADGTDPGSGMAWMDANNSPAQVQSRKDNVNRQNQQDWNTSMSAGSAAVAERKNLQAMGGAPFQQGNPNLVKGNDGYMDLFGGQGQIVGSTRPQKQVQGFGDPTNTNLEASRASQGMQDSFQQNFRMGNSQGAMPPNAGPQPRPRSSGGQSGEQMMTQNDFLTPGGGGGASVGGPSAQGAPGGGNFQMNLPTRPTGANEMDIPSSGRNFGANWLAPKQGPQPQGPSTVDPFELRSSYPQLPNGSPSQLDTLQQLNQFSTGTPPGIAALEAKWNNVFPNTPDNAYLQAQFPNIFAQSPSVYQAWNQILALSQQPEYKAQFGLR